MNGSAVDADHYRLVCFLVAVVFALLAIFAPTMLLAGALKFLRGNPHEALIGRVLAGGIAGIALLAAFHPLR